MIKIKRLVPEAILPKQMHEGDAGFDLYASEGVVIPPKGRVAVKTGIAIAFPPGHAMFIKDRSGLAVRHGITTMAGIIDAGYRGEYMVVLYNTTDEPYEIEQGHRIAQALLVPLPEIEILEVDALEASSRGEGGLGSTGK